MKEITKEPIAKKNFFSEVFSPHSKYLSYFGLVSFFLLFFLIEFFLSVGLESASNAVENFFEIVSISVLWLIYLVVPLILSLIIFSLTFNKPKAKFISFILSISGLVGFGIGFGIVTILYDQVLPSTKYIDLIAFSITLGSTMLISSIFTVIAVKKIH
jgi:hypothetical protein